MIPRTFAVLLLAMACAPAAEPATWCRFVPERSDDFAWENDLVAFRTYGPALRGKVEDSGVDCWLKRVPYPIIDGWYAGNAAGKSYHVDHGEGHDPYHVGASRGCGGTALWQDGRMITPGPYQTWKVEERTPARSVFTLTYRYPAAEGTAPVEEAKRFTIALGERFYRCESTFTRGGAPVADLPVVIGITTHDGKGTPERDPAGRWMSVWEVIDGSGLGTGVVLPAAADLRVLSEPTKDRSHVIALVRTDAQGRVALRGGYGWEKAGVTAAAWKAALIAAAAP